MKYQIYVLWPSLIFVDVTGLPCPTHAHMAYDHSIQEIAKEKKKLVKKKNSQNFSVLNYTALVSSTFCNNAIWAARSTPTSPKSLTFLPLCHFFVLTTFWRHLWSTTEQMHGNLESIC